ncbi:Detected protein of unknown function [Hibiscus syriacus]|uniref:Uncharacterized protein n=1 Tax=Hibiscus syriacus TaxID=106335 RepID=A0A6A2WH47_HIBSY|nr:Detected protein of unknown function [Hibiscus syriacus]
MVSSSSSSAIIHGFSATLSPNQAKTLRELSGVLSLYPERVVHLHTTRSPSFLGLQTTNPYVIDTSGSDSITGFVDTRIWPEHPSFSDGYESWFGQSDNLVKEFRSARDSDGHGTHVASIAAGSPVQGSGFFGFSVGSARGMAPTARIAVYKVCWSSGCLLSDICKAFETAMSDGVHIISLSLGSSRLPFYLDLLSIVSFRAFSNGIFVSALAGNYGPTSASVANEPPWITMVGAGTIHRDILAKIHLKNNNVSAITLMPKDDLLRKHRPLRFVGQFNSSSKFNCHDNLHGIVDPNGIVSEPHVIPTISVGIEAAKQIEDCPNSLVSGILKPDIIAPEVDILGAWTNTIGPSALIKSNHPDWGPNKIKSAIMTTSMSHKRYYHRHKPFSATSPIPDESTGNAATPFEIGAGHILPIKAMVPGLVFDSEHQDYVNFLCSLNYTNKQLQIITGSKSLCSNDGTWELNYPAIVVEAERVWHRDNPVVITGKLKTVNVGSTKYEAKIVGPKGYYKVEVNPRRMRFSGMSEVILEGQQVQLPCRSSFSQESVQEPDEGDEMTDNIIFDINGLMKGHKYRRLCAETTITDGEEYIGSGWLRAACDNDTRLAQLQWWIIEWRIIGAIYFYGPTISGRKLEIYHDVLDKAIGSASRKKECLHLR